MKIYYNKDFARSKDQINKWIFLNKYRLAGSAIFTKNNTFISKAISWACHNEYPENDFNPSHVGSLILIANDIYIFDMKPPKANITKLEDYLLNTKDDFMLIIRDFELDIEKFSFDICKRINQNYGYLSAIQSACKYLWFPFREHCSEVHLKELQIQNLFLDENANKITPENLLRILVGGIKKCV